jgi:hypothetical protein
MTNFTIAIYIVVEFGFYSLYLQECFYGQANIINHLIYQNKNLLIAHIYYLNRNKYFF